MHIARKGPIWHANTEVPRLAYIKSFLLIDIFYNIQPFCKQTKKVWSSGRTIWMRNMTVAFVVHKWHKYPFSDAATQSIKPIFLQMSEYSNNEMSQF